MFSNPETRSRAIRTIIFICIFIIGIAGINYRNRHIEKMETLCLTADIRVFVSEKPLNGLNENLICEDYFIKMIGKQIKKDLNNRISSSYFHLNNLSPDSTRITNSWYQNVKDKNFVVMQLKYKDAINATSIIGIKEMKLIQITAYSASCNVPYTYGPCARKMKEIFGYSLKTGHNKPS